MGGIGTQSADSGSEKGRSISFRLPSPPPSMNSLYGINFARRTTYMIPEARAYKTQMKVFVPVFKVSEKDFIRLDFTVAQDWFYKNGKVKRQDAQNMGKVLVDLIAEKQGWQDERVWEFSIKKVQDTSNSYVSVNEYTITEDFPHETTNGKKTSTESSGGHNAVDNNA